MFTLLMLLPLVAFLLVFIPYCYILVVLQKTVRYIARKVLPKRDTKVVVERGGRVLMSFKDMQATERAKRAQEEANSR